MSESEKRARCDGLAGHKELFEGAMGGAPKPPAGVVLSDAVLPFWASVTLSKAKRAWTQSDLIAAAELARAMHRLEIITKTLDFRVLDLVDEGVDEYVKLEKMADVLTKRIKLLSVHLQVHPLATQGTSDMQAKQNQKHKNLLTVKNTEEYSLNGLIPGLNPN